MRRNFDYLYIYFAVIPLLIEAAIMPSVTQAARFYIAPSNLSAGVNCQAEIRVETKDNTEVLNALEGVVSIPSFIKADAISYGDSAITLWLESPRIQDGKITFSGITPGGFAGDRKILSFACLSAGQGSGEIAFAGAKAYLNDGQGTLASSTAQSSQIVSLATTSSQAVVTNDRKPPEEFMPQIVSNPNLFDGAKALIFNAQDKESGISHYEILEQGVWVEASSPHRISDQTLRDPLYVRAIDNAGNFIVVLVSSGTLNNYNTTASSSLNLFGKKGINTMTGIVVIVVLLSICIFAGLYYFLRRL